jgi:KipI family sensor histidine kinase inhibitor
MIGFMPGLPFMGDLQSNLSVSRLITPRVRVPSRSVGVVEKFCVIYPNESPGGWNIIGRTPIRLFFKNKKNPSLLKPGSNVKFRLISKKEFLEQEREI